MIKRFILLAALLTCVAVAIVAYATPATQSIAAAPKLSIKFTCAHAVDYRSGQVCVHTQPRAGLTIVVRYCTGYIATSRSLKGTHYANARGDYSWTWKPETKCHGKAVAVVQEHISRRVLTASDTFYVRSRTRPYTPPALVYISKSRARSKIGGHLVSYCF